jgi:hypothetical protein
MLAIDLILPGLLCIRTGLTPLAASGLDVIVALPNLIIGAHAAVIAYSRWQLAPLKELV